MPIGQVIPIVPPPVANDGGKTAVPHITQDFRAHRDLIQGRFIAYEHRRVAVRTAELPRGSFSAWLGNDVLSLLASGKGFGSSVNPPSPEDPPLVPPTIGAQRVTGHTNRRLQEKQAWRS